MNKEECLAQVRQVARDDRDATALLIAACADMAHGDGLLLSGKKFEEAADYIISYLKPPPKKHPEFSMTYTELKALRREVNAEWGKYREFFPEGTPGWESPSEWWRAVVEMYRNTFEAQHIEWVDKRELDLANAHIDNLRHVLNESRYLYPAIADTDAWQIALEVGSIK